MSQEWYYAEESTSKGPLSQTEFDALIANGTIRSDTLVWQEGMEDWLPLGNAATRTASDATPARARYVDVEDPARADANSFVGALKDGFARYVDFKTRSTRSQFWWWALWSILLGLATSMLDVMLGMGDVGPLNSLLSLAMFLPSLAVAVRRLHDIGRTGWWYLMIFVPLVGWIVLIVFFCTATKEEPNQWGNPPQH